LRTLHESEVADAAVDGFSELNKVTGSIVESGRAPRSDLLRVEAELAGAQVKQVQARNLHQIAVASFYALLNLPGESHHEWVEPDLAVMDVNDSLPDLIDGAMAQRPEIQIARLAIEGGEAGVRAERAESLPHLSVAGNYSWLDSPVFQEDTSWSISANLSWTLFDAGMNSAQVREKEQAVIGSRAGFEQARRAVELEVRRAYLDLKSRVAAVDAAKKHKESADEGLRISRIRYQTGYGIQMELLDAQASSVRANAAYFQTVYDNLTAAAALRKALGIPLDDAELRK
ncbi:MAG: TolC family protein, partial [bacterium]